jgi:hypothetical protein
MLEWSALYKKLELGRRGMPSTLLAQQLLLLALQSLAETKDLP